MMPEGPQVSYDCGKLGVAVFIRACDACGWFVTADATIRASDDGLIPDANATCSRCGRTRMEFLGWFTEEELE